MGPPGVGAELPPTAESLAACYALPDAACVRYSPIRMRTRGPAGDHCPSHRYRYRASAHGPPPLSRRWRTGSRKGPRVRNRRPT